MGTSSPLAVCIRRRRLELRLTQRQAAERSGVSLATWQSLERHTVDARDFQELTLARAAHGLDLPDGRLFEAARRSGPENATTLAAVHPAVDGTKAATPERLVEELQSVLLDLAHHSESDFLLVYGHTIELADHLLMHTSSASERSGAAPFA